MNKGLFAIFTLFLTWNMSLAQKSQVKYKTGKRIDFQSLLIEGEKKKADYSVVTGNLGEEDFGLLKMKKNFVKEMKFDAKESIQ